MNPWHAALQRILNHILEQESPNYGPGTISSLPQILSGLQQFFLPAYLLKFYIFILYITFLHYKTSK